MHSVTLALLVLDHADPVGQHAAIQNTTSTLEHLPAQSEPSLGGGLGDRISDGEPTARQVPDTTLDSQLMEGLLTWSIWLWECPWTVDPWRGRRVWSYWNSQFFNHRGLHDLVMVL